MVLRRRHLTVLDEEGIEKNIGDVKIGFINQDHGRTHEILPDEFIQLDDKFFSLGQDPEYYKNIKEHLSEEISSQLLVSLRDIANDEDILTSVSEERVFTTSLLRGVSLSVIRGQFKRILSGEVPLTEFNFTYKKEQSDVSAQVELDFNILPDSKPPTNIHALIGRNGVGKTTLLNNMISTIVDSSLDAADVGKFYLNSHFTLEIPDNYFSSITSISFSAFDPFIPPENQPDRSRGTCYFYIGLKNNNCPENSLKKHSDLQEEFIESLLFCFSLSNKKRLWLNAIKKLESDDNFKEMELTRLVDVSDNEQLKVYANNTYERMSSGHAIILLSLTKLIETIEEKTLVLIDEPEGHLHPPLLSAFMRALSDLLISTNALAIIATHSPVVLQETTKACTWILHRIRLEGDAKRPLIETFGENVGVLTHEIFGLEVKKSGFHQLLNSSVLNGGDYESILEEYNQQLGFEARAILKALIYERDSNDSH